MKKTLEKIYPNKLFLLVYITLFTSIALTGFLIGNNAGQFGDQYHMLTSGREIIENPSFLYNNTLFCKEGYGNLIQQWLYDILLYGSYSVLGWTGVRLFTLIQYILLAVLTYRFMRLTGITRKTACIGTLAFPIFSYSYISCRPEMISVCLLLIQCIIIEKYRNDQKPARLYILPVLMLIEMNIHMTFWIFHFVLLLPYLVPIKILHIKNNSIRIKQLILPVLLMAAALFVNPYREKGILILWYSRNITKAPIDEIKPIEIFSLHTFFLALGLFMIIVAFQNKRLSSTTVFVFFGTAFMYAMMSRNMIFYAIGVMYAFRDATTDANTAAYWNYFENLAKSRKKYAISVACALCYIVLMVSMYTYRQKTERTIYKEPTAALEYLKQNEDTKQIKMYVNMNIGAYMTWNNIGHIYLEGKTEPYLKEINGHKDIVMEYVYMRNTTDGNDIQAFLDEYDFDYLFVDFLDHSIGAYLTNNSDYECVVEHKSTESGKTDPTGTKDEYVLWRLYKHIR